MAGSFQLQCQIQQNSVPEFSGIETTFFYKCGLIYIEEYFCGKKLLCGISQRHFQGKISSQKVLFIRGQLITKQQNSYLAAELRREYPPDT